MDRARLLGPQKPEAETNGVIGRSRVLVDQSDLIQEIQTIRTTAGELSAEVQDLSGQVAKNTGNSRSKQRYR